MGTFGRCRQHYGYRILLGFLTPLSTPNVILVSALIAIAGFSGDVVISAIKRDKGIKDMGR